MTRWLCGECGKGMIDTESVRRAITLTEYFKSTATKVQNLVNENSLNGQHQAVLFHLPPQFSTARGIEIAASQGMKERAFKDFLSRNTGILFHKESHGEYRKL